MECGALGQRLRFRDQRGNLAPEAEALFALCAPQWAELRGASVVLGPGLLGEMLAAGLGGLPVGSPGLCFLEQMPPSVAGLCWGCPSVPLGVSAQGRMLQPCHCSGGCGPVALWHTAPPLVLLAL